MTLSGNMAALAASFAAATVTATGILFVWRYRALAERYGLYAGIFAAAILITAALTHLYPESQELTPRAPTLVLAGYAALFIMQVLAGPVETSMGTERWSVAFAPVIGIGLHSFVDGLVYATAFTIDIHTGVGAVAGLVVHEFSEGILLYLIVRRAGAAPLAAGLIALMAAGLTTPAGTYLALHFIEDLSDSALGMLLAAAAGALLFVGGTHLAHQMVKGTRLGLLFVFFAGLALAVYLLAGEAHVH